MNKKEYIEKYGEELYKEHNKKRAEQNRKYRQKNKEKWNKYANEYQKEWRIKNKVRCNKLANIYRLKNKDKVNKQRRERYTSGEFSDEQKTYRLKNRDEINMRRKEQNKSEEYRKKRRIYRQKNYENYKSYNKKWRENNKDKVKEYDCRKRAKRKLYGFNIIAYPIENKFLTPLIWHHLSDTDVIPIPEWLHIRFGGYDKEKHRKLVLNAIRKFFNEKYYNIKNIDKFEYYYSLEWQQSSTN